MEACYGHEQNTQKEYMECEKPPTPDHQHAKSRTRQKKSCNLYVFAIFFEYPPTRVLRLVMRKMGSSLFSLCLSERARHNVGARVRACGCACARCKG